MYISDRRRGKFLAVRNFFYAPRAVQFSHDINGLNVIVGHPRRGRNRCLGQVRIHLEPCPGTLVRFRCRASKVAKCFDRERGLWGSGLGLIVAGYPLDGLWQQRWQRSVFDVWIIERSAVESVTHHSSLPSRDLFCHLAIEPQVR
jgi:hypothetical protein